MITLTREEAQQVLDALNGGGWTVKDYAVELLRARLSAPEPIQVLPHEFIKAVTGKEDLVGIPVMMSVWPTAEDA
jgi:hypothetical protein